MANYANLIATIKQYIKANGNNEITGQMLQEKLLEVVGSLGVGFQYMGEAFPTTQPGSNDNRMLYFATQTGNYINFGGKSITASGLYTLTNPNGVWRLDTIISGLADQTALDAKQDKLVSGTNIKTVNGNSLLGSGNISITGGGSSITVDASLSKTSTNPVQNKAIASELEQMKSDTAAKQDKLTSGTNIKTINGNSLLGSGDLKIEGGGSVTVDDALSGTSTNPVQNKVIDSKIKDVETVITNTQSALTEEINTVASNKQNLLESGVNIKTINGNSLLGEGDLKIEGGGSVTVDDALSGTSTNPVQNKVITAILNKGKALGVPVIPNAVITGNAYVAYPASEPGRYSSFNYNTVNPGELVYFTRQGSSWIKNVWMTGIVQEITGNTFGDGDTITVNCAANTRHSAIEPISGVKLITSTSDAVDGRKETFYFRTATGAVGLDVTGILVSNDPTNLNQDTVYKLVIEYNAGLGVFLGDLIEYVDFAPAE